VHTTCYCDGFRTGCDVSPHVVRVADVPVDSELVAVAWPKRGILGNRRSLQWDLLVYVTHSAHS